MPQSNILRVKIISARKETFWYADHIGQVFKVVENNSFLTDYEVIGAENEFTNFGHSFIDRKDCVIVENCKGIYQSCNNIAVRGKYCDDCWTHGEDLALEEQAMRQTIDGTFNGAVGYTDAF